MLFTDKTLLMDQDAVDEQDTSLYTSCQRQVNRRCRPMSSTGFFASPSHAPIVMAMMISLSNIQHPHSPLPPYSKGQIWRWVRVHIISHGPRHIWCTVVILSSWSDTLTVHRCFVPLLEQDNFGESWWWNQTPSAGASISWLNHHDGVSLLVALC